MEGVREKILGCWFHIIDWLSRVPLQKAFAAVTVVLLVSWVTGVHRWWKQRHRPGPKTWPLLESLPLVIANWDRLYDYLLQFFERGHDVVWAPLGFGFESIYIAEPSLVEHMLKTNFANYPKGHLITRYMEELLGRGIFGSDGASWRTQRKVASFEFASAKLRHHSTGVYRDHALTLLRIIGDFSRSDRPMDFQDLAMRMTLDSIGKLGFGVELGCLLPSLPPVTFARAFDRANELSFHRYCDPLWTLKRLLNLGEERELKSCLEDMDSFCYDLIKKRREEMKASEGRGDVTEMPDLLSRFMSLRTESNEAYSDQALRDVLLNFIIAGRDTSAITLSWFIYRLCLHPEVAEKILAETQTLEKEGIPLKLKEESGDNHTRFAELLTYQTLGELHYLRAALSETLRLHPAVPLDGKTVLADDVLPNGVRVQKGSLVSYCSYAMGRLERIWGPDAKEFRPERWLKDGVYQPESPFKFITFHAGPRMCLGKDSALLQMKMAAALLVRFFEFQLVPDHEVRYRVMFVLTMSQGLKVTASPRMI